MDLFIQTLSGTNFELRVSPFETIFSIKSKLQRLEGISISQQHLIWRSVELEDGYCLHDYGIKSGATLTLVLAMRGGPINMRRVSLEEPSLQEMADYMDENRDELWDKLMNDNKQVTLLVYREGNQLNFYRVYDGGDGTLSPYSDSISASSAYNGQEDETPPSNKIMQKENLITKDKMRLLQEQIATKGSKKLPSAIQPPPCTSSANLPSANLAKRRIQFGKHSKQSITSPLDLNQDNDSHPGHSPHIQLTPSPIKVDTIPLDKMSDMMRKSLPPVSRKAKITKDLDTEGVSPSNRLSESSMGSSSNKNLSPNFPSIKSKSRLPGLHSNSRLGLLPSIDKKDSSSKSARTKRRSLKPLGTVGKNTSSKLIQQFVTPPTPPSEDDSRLHSSVLSNESYLDAHLEETLRNSQLPDIIRDPVEYENYKNLLKWVHPKGNDSNESLSMRGSKTFKDRDTNGLPRPSSKSRRKTDSRPSSTRLRSSKLHAQGNLTHLPPVNNDPKHLPSLTVKKKPRCSTCTKKLGLATTYQCRCGSKFCAKHRYPEAHTCTYDYKTEGRNLLQRSNPVVTAPKLPKI